MQILRDLGRSRTAFVISTRTQFIAAIGTTGLTILAVAAYGWWSLDNASQAAEDATTSLARIYTVELLEGHIHDMEAQGDSSNGPEEYLELERLLRDVEDLAWPDPIQEQVVERIGFALRGDPAADRQTLSRGEPEQLISKLMKRSVRNIQAQVNETSRKQARDQARTIAKIGVAAVTLFGILSSLVYLRFRRERQRALDQLRQSDRLAALGTIAASMAHELNNPLATVQGCAAAVRDRVRRMEGDRDDALEYLDMIETETRRCSGLVGSLRDLARDAPLAVSNAHLGPLAKEVVGLVTMNRHDKTVDIRVEESDDAEILCDPDKIKQLLLNLVLNARDACDEGGHVVIRVSHRPEDTAVVEVEDDGRGIAPRELSRVFQAFHTGKARGLGIGLFLCDRIARLHGGTIHAESEGQGRGSRFVVRLPTRLGQNGDHPL